MSSEQPSPRFSGAAAFFFGVGTAIIVGALTLVFVRYRGRERAPAATSPQISPFADTSAATETSSIADHVAALSGTNQPDASPATKSSSNPARVLLSGTIELDKPIAHSVTGTVVVFVIARDRSGKGHPVLAKRLEVASFPTTFSLGAEDAMMGQTPPDHVSLEARIDLDGDAMTREPGVPEARIESVALGSRNLTLTLKRGV